MSNVTIDHLVKEFPLAGRGATGGAPRTFRAVDDISLDIADGEFLVLLGPSGCGKTTTLRCIAGLEEQTTGDIYIGERLVNGLPAGDRDIAFVFQFYALYPHLKVYDNIAFPLRAMKVDQGEVDERVKAVARLLRIDGVLHRRPGSLPSGEQQRVALGRAIIRRPRVFLMDEPLTNLDAALRADMRAELKRLQADLKTTTVYVTHDQTEAMSMAHRIAIMNQGVLQQVGTSLEVYDQPATLFVASFIGTPPMNFVPCRVDDGALVDADGRFRLALDHIPDVAARLAAATGPELLFGARAEDVQLRPGHDNGAIAGHILVRELLGDEIVYEVAVGEHLVRAKTEPTVHYDPGATVSLTFDPARVHLFDAASEQALRAG